MMNKEQLQHLLNFYKSQYGKVLTKDIPLTRVEIIERIRRVEGLLELHEDYEGWENNDYR